MSYLRTSVVVDLTGNLQQKAGRYGRALQTMGDKGASSMRRMRRATRLTGLALDKVGNRYTTLFSGAAVFGAGKMVMDLETRFVRLGIQANKTDAEMGKLKQTIFDTAQERDIRVDPSQITSAVEAIVEKTGDLDFAEQNIRNIGLALQATGAGGNAIGEIMAEFLKMGITAPEDILAVIDLLNRQGKEGAFTLQNLAALGPRVITAYTATGRSGADALREMGAALQVIRMGTGSSEMAATAFEATLRTLTDPAKIKALKSVGINVFDAEAAKQGKEVLRPINDLMVEIIKKSDGAKSKLGTIFDAEAMRAFNAASAEYSRTGDIASLEKFMSVQADGAETLRDAARAANTSAAAVRNLTTATQQYVDDKGSGPLKAAADGVNSLSPEAQRTGLNAAFGVAGTLGALIVGRKVKGLAGLFKRKPKNPFPASPAATVVPTATTKAPAYSLNAALGYKPTPKPAPSFYQRGKQWLQTSKFGKRIPYIGTALTALGTGATLLDDNATTQEKAGSVGGLAGGALGTWSGAAAGAAIGSVVPVIGTAIGAALGGLGGYLAGEYAGNKVGQEVGGLIKVQIESEQPAKVTALESSNRHVDLEATAYNGTSLGAM